MSAIPPSLVPLIKLAEQLNDVSEHIGEGVLAYQETAAVAYVRRELWLAAEHLIHVLESTSISDGDVSAAA